ncbi:hypothetical protein CERSUDRAFT_128429 [Gelatoporia subvermispora B]|uniref:Methyltransferase domain-containing protein n=1 Tax=Ceriporiopsis subvermispora (strain B) TaxID=914234 RepID=M2RRP8_CERS8|nr:hypothetical protein CERSUDRAFT_128429 [Gelatoporia subvermispora B]
MEARAGVGITPLPLEAHFDSGLEKDFRIAPEDWAFLKTASGITDEEELRKHVLKIQADAYAIFPYPCIRLFAFVRRKLAGLPAYERMMKLGKEREGAILLDIGCAFGNDIHRAVADGYPIENVIASDIEPGFWRLGHELFRTTPETFPVPFVGGDAFDPAFLPPTAPFTAPPGTPRPDLRTLTTLAPLLGHVSFIHASSLFHLFDEEEQVQLARALAGLLSPAPGSMILGLHTGRPEKGWNEGSWPGGRRSLFCHSPESWAALWDGEVFEKGSVEVETRLVPVDVSRLGLASNEGVTMYRLLWSVTRL